MVLGGGGDDSVRGDGRSDRLPGGLGDDTLSTGDSVKGNDVADGGPGRDACSAEPPRRDKEVRAAIGTPTPGQRRRTPLVAGGRRGRDSSGSRPRRCAWVLRDLPAGART